MTIPDGFPINTTVTALALDLEDLIVRGLISQAGDWYWVPDLHALPKSAVLEICRMEKVSNGWNVQFRAQPKMRARAVNLFKGTT